MTEATHGTVEQLLREGHHMAAEHGLEVSASRMSRLARRYLQRCSDVPWAAFLRVHITEDADLDASPYGGPEGLPRRRRDVIAPRLKRQWSGAATPPGTWRTKTGWGGED